MGQLNEAIQTENVLDFYEIKNFVETGTGIAEVVRSVHDINSEVEKDLFSLKKVKKR